MVQTSPLHYDLPKNKLLDYLTALLLLLDLLLLKVDAPAVFSNDLKDFQADQVAVETY